MTNLPLGLDHVEVRLEEQVRQLDLIDGRQLALIDGRRLEAQEHSAEKLVEQRLEGPGQTNLVTVENHLGNQRDPP